MSTLNELQQRLAVASERNRTNNERRTQVLADIKEKFGCDSIEELRALADKKVAQVETSTAEAEAKRQKAEEAVVAVEVAVGVRS